MTAMAAYSKLPPASALEVSPFTAHVDETKLHHFKQLLELSPIAPPVYENTAVGSQYGITREWLEGAKKAWLTDFNWRRHEDRINSFPNFRATVLHDDGGPIDIHFLGLFSERKDAVPILFLHGWPGSICEFLDMLHLLTERYKPQDLPYHVIVPSLPGYAFSAGPPLDKDYGIDVAAGALNSLMIGLGFESGYLTHGGDLGSFVSRFLALKHAACKGMHVNMMGMPPEVSGEMSEAEKEALNKATEMIDTGYAFALEQGTRPATTGHVLSSSPLALLSWIGEKFLAWTDDDPPLDKILESVTLYWLTDTMPRCMYHNRALANANDNPKMARMSVATNFAALKLPFVEKPCGYSLFAQEIVPIPESWASKSCNLVFFNQHPRGGHFAAMERPKELLNDIEEYVKIAWGKTTEATA